MKMMKNDLENLLTKERKKERNELTCSKTNSPTTMKMINIHKKRNLLLQ